MAALTRRTFLFGGAAVLGSAALTACANPNELPASMDAITQASGGKPNRGGILYFGLSTDPANFDPQVSTGTASDYLRQLTYNGLLTYDGNGVVIGDLAEEFGWSDPLTYKVRIRKDVQFHNGSTLTTTDVAFSFTRMMAKATAASSAPLLAQVASVKATDASTVEFRFKVHDVAFPFALAAPPSTIVSKAWIESGADSKTQVMGTGPFTFVERVPGVSITFARFDHYFVPELPYLNGMVFQPMGDDYARVTALRAATVDMIDYVPATHIDVIKNNPQLQFASDTNFGFGFVGFVTSRKPFDDVRVRRAFAMGIDRSAVLDTAFLGHGKAMTGSLMPQAFASYASKLDSTVPYDPDQARFLLKQAGHENMTTPMVTTSSYSVISLPAQAMLPSLRSAGVDINLIEQEWLTFRSSVSTNAYPVHAWGTAPKFGDPASLSDFLGTTGTFSKNLGFSDDRIDALLKQGRQTIDASVRSEIYFDVEKRALDLMPMTYTVRREQGEAHHTYVRGYQHPPKGAWSAVSLRATWMENRG